MARPGPVRIAPVAAFNEVEIVPSGIQLGRHLITAPLRTKAEAQGDDDEHERSVGAHEERRAGPLRVERAQQLAHHVGRDKVEAVLDVRAAMSASNRHERPDVLRQRACERAVRVVRLGRRVAQRAGRVRVNSLTQCRRACRSPLASAMRLSRRPTNGHGGNVGSLYNNRPCAASRA